MIGSEELSILRSRITVQIFQLVFVVLFVFTVTYDAGGRTFEHAHLEYNMQYAQFFDDVGGLVRFGKLPEVACDTIAGDGRWSALCSRKPAPACSWRSFIQVRVEIASSSSKLM